MKNKKGLRFFCANLAMIAALGYFGHVGTNEAKIVLANREYQDIKAMEEEISAIAAKKEDAVKSQNFEDAAKFRDEEKKKISELEDMKKQWADSKASEKLVVTENEIEEKVAEEFVDNEEAKNSLKTKGETWKKTKDKYHKVMNSEDEYGKLGEQNLKGIQETIKNEEIFQHETSNKVYLDRFNTILDEDSQAFYQGKRIEEKAGELEVMTEDGKPSIYDLIREIENSDPTNASAEPIKISLDDEDQVDFKSDL